MVNSGWISNFRNENNERAIYLLGHGSELEEGCDCLDDVNAYGRPELFIEDCRVTIRSKRF